MIRTALALVLALMTTFAQAADPVRLVCIGDSITQGRAGKGDRVPTYSWRYPLWKHCVDAGFNVEMVGSMTTGFEGRPVYEDHAGKSFVNHHEGRWGWTTRAVADALVDASKGWTADVAVIFLGTNDKNLKEKNEAPTLQAMRDIVATLRARKAEVKIAIGLPFQEWEPFPTLSASYTALAAELSTKESPVIVVPTAQGWVSKPDKPDTCTVDWVHPNPKGDAHVADRVFAAIKDWLK